MRVGDSTSTCDGTTEGAIRFDADCANTLDYCDGSGWLTLLTSSVGNGIVNNGNSFAAPMIIGTNDAQELRLETNSATRLTINTSGSVGIGTTVPAVALDVHTGSINAASICDENNANCLDLSAGVGGVSYPLQADDGSVGAPSYSFSSDTDTGIFRDNASGDMRFAFGGTPYMMINSAFAQKVQIWSTDLRFDDNYGLTWGPGSNVNLIGNNGSDSMTFETSNTARMTLDTNGNLGIGTTNPGSKLHIYDASGDREMIQHRGNAHSTNLLLGTVNGETAVVGGGSGDSLILYSNNDVNSGMIINSFGDIGIGTDTPAVELDVHTGSINAAEICDEDNANCLDLSTGSGYSAGDTFLAGDGAVATPSISFQNDTDSGFYLSGGNSIGITVSGVNQGAMTNSSWEIYRKIRTGNCSVTEPCFSFTGDNDTGLFSSGTDELGFTTNATERMVIDASGNVGVGTASPSQALHVHGKIAVTGSTPSVSDCGTSPTITGNDTRGRVKLGTGSPANCTITFSSAYSSAPICTTTSLGSNGGMRILSISTTAMVATPIGATTDFTYICLE